MTGKSTSIQTEDAALCSAEIVLGDDGAPPTAVMLMPFGDPIPARDSRVFRLVDKAHAERVIAATKSYLASCDMMIDYDHQSAATPTQGGTAAAPAAGWIKGFEVREDGIWGSPVEWTPPAAKALANREYRYSSPSFRVAKESREVTRITNLGIVNEPNFDLPALASRQAGSPGEPTDMTKITLALASLATALAIPAEGLDESKVLAAIDQLKSGKEGAETALASIRSELQLGDDASTETVLASVKSARAAGVPDPTKYVPKAGFDDLTARLAKLEEDKVLASVDQAVKDGKLAPAMKDWAISLGKKDAAELASYLDKAVPVLASVDVRGEPPRGDKGKLSEEEKAICALVGVSEADYLKTRDEEAV